MKVYYVYILLCKDKSYYIGITNDIDRRVDEHQNGINSTCYTFKRRPIELVFAQAFQNVLHAISFEKQIKGWSRAKKQALIHSDWQRLIRLSKNYTQFGKADDKEANTPPEHPSTGSG